MSTRKTVGFPHSRSLQLARATTPNSAIILGLGTAVPAQRLDQNTIYRDVLAPLLDGNRYARAIFRHAGVDFRHFVAEARYYDSKRTTQERNERYVTEALRLGEEAINRCLNASGLSTQDVDDFIVASCTGIDTPGLDLQLAGRLGMRPDLRRATILGMGCYAALPSLLRATEAARAGRRVLVLAVELCSLHFQPDDASTQNVVSAALFADGAAAVLVGPEQQQPLHRENGYGPAPGPRLLDFETLCDYTTFDQMAFHLTDHGFQMRLGISVPDVLAANVEAFLERLLQRNGLLCENIAVWAVHPGSAKILDNIEERLALPPTALDASRTVLRRYGNMSSPTILFVLEHVQRHMQPETGAYGVVLAFGPGLTLEGALLQW